MKECKDCDKLLFPVNLIQERYKGIFEMIPFSRKERNDSIDGQVNAKR